MENFDGKYERKNPFSVPDHYFDRLTDEVMERVKEEKKAPKIGWVTLLKPYLGLAAVFLLALFVVQVILPHFIDDSRMLKKEGKETIISEEVSKAEVPELDSTFNPSSEEILEYLSTEVSDYDLIYAELY